MFHQLVFSIWTWQIWKNECVHKLFHVFLIFLQQLNSITTEKIVSFYQKSLLFSWNTFAIQICQDDLMTLNFDLLRYLCKNLIFSSDHQEFWNLVKFIADFLQKVLLQIFVSNFYLVLKEILKELTLRLDTAGKLDLLQK